MTRVCQHTALHLLHIHIQCIHCMFLLYIHIFIALWLLRIWVYSILTTCHHYFDMSSIYFDGQDRKLMSHMSYVIYVYVLTPATVAVPEVLLLHWGCSHTPPSRLTHRTTTLTQPSAHAPKWPLLATNWCLRNHRENDPWWLKIEGCWGLAVNFPSDCPKWPSAGAWLSVNWFHPLKYNESLPA